MLARHKDGRYPREAFDDDLTFAVNLLMDTMRTQIELIERAVANCDEEPLTAHVTACAKALHLLADQGDFIAFHLADELNEMIAKTRKTEPES